MKIIIITETIMIVWGVEMIQSAYRRLRGWRLSTLQSAHAAAAKRCCVNVSPTAPTRHEGKNTLRTRRNHALIAVI